MKKFNIFVVLFFFMLIFAQLSTYARVQDIYGRYAEVKKIKIIRVAEPPQYYELDNKKYTLKSLEEYVKQLQKSQSNKIILTWRIEIERSESFYIIEELVKVLKMFSDSSISISPMGKE